MITFNIPLSTLRAARTHAAEKDTRYYLCGVYLDFKNSRVVATDGHRMIVCDGPYLDAPSIIIPNALIDSALKCYTGNFGRGKSLGSIDVQCVLDGTMITISTPNNGSVSGQLIDGKFPDYARVLPTVLVEEKGGHINHVYVYEACEAILTYRNKSKGKSEGGLKVYMRGDSPALVTDNVAGIVVVVMPMKSAGNSILNSILDHAHKMPELVQVAA